MMEVLGLARSHIYFKARVPKNTISTYRMRAEIEAKGTIIRKNDLI